MTDAAIPSTATGRTAWEGCAPPRLDGPLVHDAGGGDPIAFLAYPLGLGVWLSFTDSKIGKSGSFVGIENYDWLSDDKIFWGAVAFTVGYTVIASIVKFALASIWRCCSTRTCR